MKIREFQRHIEEIYRERDQNRGRAANFLWLVEEVGELAKAVNRPNTIHPQSGDPQSGDSQSGDQQNLREEFADVFAWLVSLASLCEVDLEQAARDKYADGCPKCHSTPCSCP